MADVAVSVVIPTRNRPGFLAQSLRSVLGQRVVELEVIVVDDGSDAASVDGVPGVLDSRVRVLRHRSRLGVSAARNTGIEAARGTWVAFLDDDDLWAPQKLAAQLRGLADSPECGWSCAGVLVVNEKLRIIGCERPPAERDVAVPMLVRQTVPGGGSGVIAARELLDRAGGFDTQLTMQADWEMHLRLAQHSPLASVDAPLVAYRVHRGSGSLDVEVCDRELDVIDRTYAPLRETSGVALDRAHWARWKATAYLRTGQRWRSFRTRRSSGTDRGGAGLVRDALVSAVPGSMRLADFRQARRVPASWRTDGEAWLAGYR